MNENKYNLRYSYIFFLFLLIFFTTAFSFSGGDGSISNPYNISSCLELQNMSSNLSANYQLISNIDCSSISNFERVGSCGGSNCLSGGDDFPFTGNFNGNSFAVSDLTLINLTTSDEGWGLFGFIENSIISNVNIQNAFINVSSSSIGSLVGYSTNSIIINSTSSGTIISSDVLITDYVGGIVGNLHQSELISSSASNTVIGDRRVGGLAGYSFQSDVTNSYSTGDVFGSDVRVGGLIGTLRDSELNYTYSSSSVLGNSEVGGLVGYTRSNSIIKNSYSSGDVTGNASVGGLIGSSLQLLIYNTSSSGDVIGNTSVGGLIGYDAVSLLIRNSFSSSSVSGNSTIGGLIGGSVFSSIYETYSSGDVTGNSSVGGLIGSSTGSSNIENSFTISSVSGSDLLTTGSFVGNLSSPGSVLNNYWNNITGNPSNAIGSGPNGNINEIQDNISYFYDQSNPPFIGNWDTNIWNFTGLGLPSLIVIDNIVINTLDTNTNQNTGVTTLFPLSSQFILFIVILGYFILI